jgi:hypothetical protein
VPGYQAQQTAGFGDFVAAPGDVLVGTHEDQRGAEVLHCACREVGTAKGDAVVASAWAIFVAVGRLRSPSSVSPLPVSS